MMGRVVVELRLAAVLVGTILAISPVAVRAANYVVDLGGNDSATGTAAAPWKTLQHAADVVGPGDFVTVHPGNYAGFYLDTSGSAAAPIEFFAQPGVLINQPNPVRPDHGINLEDASHVIVDGFAVTGMNKAGVRSVGVDGDEFASFVTIRNVHSYNNGYWGILTGFVNDLLIENNETSGSIHEHGIYVSNSGDRPVIRNNLSWGNHANGIHMNGDKSEGGDGIITGALVSGNIIHDNGVGGGSGINMDGVQNSRIENNLLYNNHASGISLYRIDGGGGSSGNVVVNNTVRVASGARWALNIQSGSTNNTVLNNILLNDDAAHGALDISENSRSGFFSDYNAMTPKYTVTVDGEGDFLTLAQWKALPGNTGIDVHSFAATAAQLFQNPAANDYHLLATSPAINAGTASMAPTVDLDGKSRPIGASIDIGAFEYGVTSVTGDYNHNGIVDAADYSVWRDTLGSTTNLSADGNGNGHIDAPDYGVWANHFGVGGSGAGATVPEPFGFDLSLAGLVLVCSIVRLRNVDCHNRH